MRLIFFAFDDRPQITYLFVDSYTRLAVAVGIFTKGNCSLQNHGKKLIVLTNAATGNLIIQHFLPFTSQKFIQLRLWIVQILDF